jgi:hypothetical protein
MSFRIIKNKSQFFFKQTFANNPRLPRSGLVSTPAPAAQVQVYTLRTLDRRHSSQ